MRLLVVRSTRARRAEFFFAPRRSSSDLLFFLSLVLSVHMNRRCLVVFDPVHWITQRIVASNPSSCLATK